MNVTTIRLPLLFLILLLTTGLQANAQSFFPAKKYPNQQFRNPLGIPFSLVGNFGECRPNHFHSGIDIRTEGKENYPVYAIADGFVSKIKIEAGGFGNAIYITHANGYTSLYAHLNKFYPALEQFVREKQYATKSWAQDFYLFPHQFPVRQGMQIAWSGNTGSSQGPHLHLEIRDAKTEAPLNGLLFFNSIQDNLPPAIKEIALYNGEQSIYEQKPKLVKVTKTTTGYSLPSLLQLNSTKAFLGIHGDDYMKIATGTLGIYEMRLYVDDKPFFAWQMDNISYDITRYMNALADYKTKKNNGPWIQLCRKLPNDKLPVYKSFTASNGVIDLSDGQVKKIRIEVYDTRYNKSSLEFNLQGNSSSVPIPCQNKLTNGKEQHFKNSYIEFTLPDDALYDDICFRTSIKPNESAYSHTYSIHESFVPLHSYFSLWLQPKSPIPAILKDKIAVIRLPMANETSKKGKAATLDKGRVMVSVRDFGDYAIVIDQQAPVITSTLKNQSSINQAKTISFQVKEETTSILSCIAEVDGQWLRLVQKGNTFTYELDSYFPKGTHNLVIKVLDENHNLATKTFQLTR